MYRRIFPSKPWHTASFVFVQVTGINLFVEIFKFDQDIDLLYQIMNQCLLPCIRKIKCIIYLAHLQHLPLWFLYSYHITPQYEKNKTKRTFWHVRRTKTQINLHIRAVVTVFVVHMKKRCSLSYPKFAHWRFWWDCCANVQADPNLRLAQMSEDTISFVSVQNEYISSVCIQ